MMTLLLVIVGFIAGLLLAFWLSARVHADKIINLERTLSAKESLAQERASIIGALKQKLELEQQRLVETSRMEADSFARLQSTTAALEEEKKFVTEAKAALKDAFASLSAEALSQNSDVFLSMVKSEIDKQSTASREEMTKRSTAIEVMVKPLSESLSKFSSQVQEVEKSRLSAYTELKTLIGTVNGSTQKLEEKTGTLVNALKTSHVRGKYGEVGLRRVIEFTGMNEYCDFEEQVSVTTDDKKLRPDLIVRLPGQRSIVVDAKVPLSAYLQSFEAASDPEKSACHKKHVVQVREHVKSLASKAYWKQFDTAPDFVVMYVQVESAFGAALELDKELIQFAMENGVVLATPTTLIAMLRSIAFAWQQSRMTENVFELQKAGIELYNRSVTMIEHMVSVGEDINSATKSYNKLVSSLESRFLPQARKVKELGGGMMKHEIPELVTVDEVPRHFRKLPSLNGTSTQPTKSKVLELE